MSTAPIRTQPVLPLVQGERLSADEFMRRYEGGPSREGGIDRRGRAKWPPRCDTNTTASRITD